MKSGGLIAAAALAGGMFVGAGPAYAGVGHPLASGAAATLVLRTVPAVPGARVSFDGADYRTGTAGAVSIATVSGQHDLAIRPPAPLPADVGMHFSRWLDGVARPSRTVVLHAGTNLDTAGFAISYPVRLRFATESGRPVPASAVGRVVLGSSVGNQITFTPSTRPMLPANRVVRGRSTLAAVPIRYSVRSVSYAGADVVYGGSQSFYAGRRKNWTVHLLLFPMRIEVRDAFFHFAVGSAVRVALSGAPARTVRLRAGHAVRLSGLPRATYQLTAEGPGIGLSSPATLTRPMVASLLLLSWVDLATVAVFGMLFLVGLPVMGGRIRRRHGSRRLAWHSGHIEPVVEPAQAAGAGHASAAARPLAGRRRAHRAARAGRRSS